jgi:hypothetical protein
MGLAVVAAIPLGLLTQARVWLSSSLFGMWQVDTSARICSIGWAWRSLRLAWTVVRCDASPFGQ